MSDHPPSALVLPCRCLCERALRLFLERRPGHPDGLSDPALVLFEQGRVREAQAAWSTPWPASRWPTTQGEREAAQVVFGQTCALQPRIAAPAFLAERLGWSARAVACARRLI